MRYPLWFALFLYAPLTAAGQTPIDSVKHLLKEAETLNKPIKVPYYNAQLGAWYIAAHQFDSAVHYYRRVLKKKESIKDDVLIASTYNGMGVALNNMGYTDSSLYCYKEALKIYTSLGDTSNAVITDTNLSIIFKNKGLYEEALEHAFNALAKHERQKPDRALASCYNTIGNVYANIGDHERALSFYRQSLHVRKEIGYSRGVGQSYNNIAEAQMRLQQYDSALINLFKSLEIKESNAEPAATVYNNIGEVYVSLNKLQDAEIYFLKSLVTHKELNDQIGRIIVLNNLGSLALRQQRLAVAEKYLNDAALLVRQVGSTEYRRQNLELLVRLYQVRNDHPKAFQYMQELLLVRDSILNKEKAEALLNMQVRYETEQKEQRIKLLEQEKQLQAADIRIREQWVIVLIVIVSMLAIIGALLFYQSQQRKRNEQHVQTLLKELHHRVKNNLQMLSSVLSLQSQQLKDAEAVQAVKGSEGRVNAMALIHKKLYSDDQNRTINIKEYVTELVQYLIHTYGYTQQELKLNLQVEEIRLDVDKAIPVGLIINELVSNAFKYAYANQKNPELNVNLALESKNELVVEISDNGVDNNAIDLDASSSFGLKMVRLLLKELRGRFDMSQQSGTSFTLKIPVS